MKSIIQVLSGAFLILFAFTANAQTKPIVKPKYDTKTIYKPSNKKSYKTIKSKQKKSEDKKYVLQFKGGQFVFVNMERYCQEFANTDCDDMPSECHEYYSRCDDDDTIDDASSRYGVVQLRDRGEELPDGCDEIPINGSDDCMPDPSLRHFQSFLHSSRDVYSISIKTPKGRTIAYSNTKYGKKTIQRGTKFSKMKFRMPKYKGKAIIKVTNLKTKKTQIVKTNFK